MPHGLAHQSKSAEVARAIDRLNQAIADQIQRSGLALVMTTRIRDRITLRMSVCSHRTTRTDIDRTFEAITEAGRRLANTLIHNSHEESPSC